MKKLTDETTVNAVTALANTAANLLDKCHGNQVATALAEMLCAEANGYLSSGEAKSTDIPRVTQHNTIEKCSTPELDSDFEHFLAYTGLSGFLRKAYDDGAAHGKAFYARRLHMKAIPGYTPSVANFDAPDRADSGGEQAERAAPLKYDAFRVKSAQKYPHDFIPVYRSDVDAAIATLGAFNLDALRLLKAVAKYDGDLISEVDIGSNGKVAFSSGCNEVGRNAAGVSGGAHAKGMSIGGYSISHNDDGSINIGKDGVFVSRRLDVVTHVLASIFKDEFISIKHDLPSMGVSLHEITMQTDAVLTLKKGGIVYFMGVPLQLRFDTVFHTHITNTGLLEGASPFVVDSFARGRFSD